MPMETRKLTATLSLLLLASAITACEAQSRVQSRYMDAQSECRTTAESSVAAMPNAAAMPPGQQSAELVNQFSICMNKSGWPVTNPLKSKEKKTASVPPFPAEPVAAARPATAANPAPQPNTPAQYQSAPYAPTDTTPGRQF